MSAMASRCRHDMVEGTCAICLGQEAPSPRTPVAEVRASELFDFAASNVRWTKLMACETLGWSEHTLAETIRVLRSILAGDNINLVVNYEDGDYFYKLVGDLESAMPWATIRLHSVESQLNTIADVTKSICNATSAKSREGRRARMIMAQVNVLQMQLATVDN